MNFLELKDWSGELFSMVKMDEMFSHNSLRCKQSEIASILYICYCCEMDEPLSRLDQRK